MKIGGHFDTNIPKIRNLQVGLRVWSGGEILVKNSFNVMTNIIFFFLTCILQKPDILSHIDFGHFESKKSYNVFK